MTFQQLKELLIENDSYAGDIEFGPGDEFIGFVYAKNFKFDSDGDQNHFATPIQAEEQSK